MRFYRWTFILSMFFAAVPAFPADSQPSCAQCAEQSTLLGSQEALRTTQTVLLKKNRDYLATLSKDDLSKSIKVKSNILILVVRLETLKNNIDSLRETVGSQTCQACAKRRSK